MKVNTLQTRSVIFWALVVFFAALVGGITKRWMFWGHRMPLLGFAVIGIIFCALAATLLVLTLKLKEPFMQKFFFILTGASAVCIPIFVILHNLVYGLFFHGKDGDEAVFFILAVLVCPALFLLGVLGSIVLLISGRLRKKNIAC
ncbi:MAG: hypothetical protein NTW93_07960 [Phycisphaerae bacterium]|nr:hypothetical protein [Phycisphaerae bacterium]